MTQKISIQLKAALLLIIFSLNTIIGFACALGVDMSFNSKHHQEEQQTKIAVHVHANGQKHDHHKTVDNHSHGQKKSNKKDDCCNDKVVKIQTAEKNIVAKTMLDAPVFVAMISSYFAINLLDIIKSFPPKNIKRFFYPPPPDILVTIQKFQV